MHNCNPNADFLPIFVVTYKLFEFQTTYKKLFLKKKIELYNHMKKIPIVFCFDDKLELPAGVCLTSLLVHANPETFYDIFILHSDKCTFSDSRLHELPSKYNNCSMTFRCVGNEFESAFEIRGITVSAYYRLLIPEIIPEYDKIIYSDVDVIFRKDLAQIYESTDMTGFYMAGVVDPMPDAYVFSYIKKLNLLPEDYIYSGNLIINSELIRADGIVQQFVKEANHSAYKYQDMDIINIVCNGKVKKISPEFCLSVSVRECAAYQKKTLIYTIQELEESLKDGIVHYNGAKPWVQYCPDFDIWWEYYRKSIFFDQKYYFDFFNRKMNDYDLLPLWKRIKILLRWFVLKASPVIASR